jgi:hypothetical protein
VPVSLRSTYCSIFNPTRPVAFAMIGEVHGRLVARDDLEAGSC